MQVEQHLSEIQNVVDDTLALAKKLGATSAEASISKVQGISVACRMQEVETVEFTNDGGLGVCVFVGNKKGSASTADLSPQALKLTVQKAVEIAKYTSEDECAGIADADMIATHIPDLDLYHPQALDTEKALALALESEKAGLEQDERISNSDGASYNANLGVRVYGNSNGINAGFPSSRYSLSCVLIAQHQEDMQRDYAFTVSREADKLESASSIGEQAALQTVSRLGAQKINTAKVPVLFHRDIASRGLASSPFDNEGVRTTDMDIVNNGILQDYLLSSYSARKLKLKTNGHAGGIHNCIVSDTGHSDEALLREMGTGLMVTELMGQGVNIVNGDYSRGAAGFWVENGVIQYPVHEITIAGNLKDMFANIVAIGKEREIRGALQTGSILVSEMQVAGV